MASLYCALIKLGVKFLNRWVKKYKLRFKIMHCSGDIIRVIVIHKDKKVFDYTIYL